MAYSRRRPARRRSYRRRRPATRKWKTRSRRTSYRRKSSSRRFARAVLSKSSLAKRDTRIGYSDVNATNPNGSGTYTQNGPLLIGGPNYYYFMHLPTAMDITYTDTTTRPNPKVFNASRSATTCFMRGLKESMDCATNDGTSWNWRRICFSLKEGYKLLVPNVGPPTSGDIQNKVYLEDPSLGYVRQWTNIYNSFSGSNRGYIDQILFKGTRQFDWVDPFTAQVDKDRVRLHFDKMMTIKSGNASGTIRNMKFWHPMNKNLTYSEDELGFQEGGTSSGPYAQVYASSGAKGMGDYFVLDIVNSNPAATTSSTLQWNSTSTMYWREKG